MNYFCNWEAADVALGHVELYHDEQGPIAQNYWYFQPVPPPQEQLRVLHQAHILPLVRAGPIDGDPHLRFFPILSKPACLVFGPERYRQKNVLTDELEAISPD